MTNEVAKKIPIINMDPYQINIPLYFNRITNIMYVVEKGALLLINETSNNVIGHIKLERSPSDVSINEKSNTIYALISDPNSGSDFKSGFIAVIDGMYKQSN